MYQRQLKKHWIKTDARLKQNFFVSGSSSPITTHIIICSTNIVGTMQKIATQICTRLTFIPRASFSDMLRDPISNPIKERVMSTPTWPVPYYQRISKAYPVRGIPRSTQSKKP